MRNRTSVRSVSAVFLCFGGLLMVQAGTLKPATAAAGQARPVIPTSPVLERGSVIPYQWAMSIKGFFSTVPKNQVELDDCVGLVEVAGGLTVLAGTATIMPEGGGSQVSEIIVMAVDPFGNIAWKILYKRSADFPVQAVALIRAGDGDVYVLGSSYTQSLALVMKVGPQGTVRWLKGYQITSPASRSLATRGIVETANGDCLLAVQGEGGLFAVIRIDPAGNIVWSGGWRPAAGYTSYSESGLRSIAVTSDGGFILAGHTVEGRAEVLKLGPGGDVQWRQSYLSNTREGFNRASEAHVILPLEAGGFLVAGMNRYVATDNSSGSTEGWLCRLDAGGGIVWLKGYPEINDLAATSDGGFLVVDPYLLRVDSSGNAQWRKKIKDMAFGTVGASADGGYLLSGILEHDGGTYEMGLAKLNDSSFSENVCGLLESQNVYEHESSLSAVALSTLDPVATQAKVIVLTYGPQAPGASLDLLCTNVPQGESALIGIIGAAGSPKGAPRR